MQINIDLPETLALQFSQSSYPAAKVVERGLHRLGIESNQPPPRKSRKRATHNRLPDWKTDNASPEAIPDSQVPDLMDFLDDLAQRREALIDRLRPQSEDS
ncbi:hypothetical protein IQ266_22605 [filamentous cyanobacterium LEGE 11480]|uniref:Uncharacterized protein n=1 Tax=Romeriopsis navalis LEGE 11480 TaxID=2777977 RepID=A0A928VUM2_9CYAN|nr:hypothetical protein [Romeriopsis navalis]MBE9032534.1 hypothetical protein [Romeriopsis navalis LEGE 11480]